MNAQVTVRSEGKRPYIKGVPLLLGHPLPVQFDQTHQTVDESLFIALPVCTAAGMTC